MSSEDDAPRPLRLVHHADSPSGSSQDRMLTLEEAFRLYARYVGAIGLKILGRPSEVDDLVQEVFLEAARGWSSIRDPGAIKGWLAKITVRVARRRLDKRRLRERLTFRSLPEELPVVASTASPEQRALLQQVYRVLNGLPSRDRVPFCLRYLEGEALDQVAALCDCSLATAKRRIASALDSIREAVSDG